jgi:hypothetical protein
MTMALSNKLSNFLNVLKKQPMERKHYSVIHQDRVMDTGFESAVIRPNEDYFTIRLSEMHLTDAREYFRNFVPMAILVSDFTYAQNRETIPFLVDNSLVNFESLMEGKSIEFKNTRVAGPIPYIGDDVALFTGLFRLEVSDMAKSLFTLLENLVKTFDPSGLSKYLTVAKSLGQSLPSVLGMEKCEFRLGARDVYTETKGSANQFRQNYMAYINCPEQAISPGSLWVRDNRLFLGPDKKSIQPVNDYDYCLMKIEGSDTRNDYTAFPFYSLWKEAKNLLMEDALQKAKFKKAEFLQQINTCPDLTESHQEELIHLFNIKFQNSWNKQVSFSRGKEPGTITRGDDKNTAKAVTTFLQSSAVMADKLHLPASVGNRLNTLSEAWEKIPFLENPEKELDTPEKESNQIINQQLAAMKKLRLKGRPNPSKLLDAIIFTTFSQN